MLILSLSLFIALSLFTTPVWFANNKIDLASKFRHRYRIYNCIYHVTFGTFLLTVLVLSIFSQMSWVVPSSTTGGGVWVFEKQHSWVLITYLMVLKKLLGEEQMEETWGRATEEGPSPLSSPETDRPWTTYKPCDTCITKYIWRVPIHFFLISSVNVDNRPSENSNGCYWILYKYIKWGIIGGHWAANGDADFGNLTSCAVYII